MKKIVLIVISFGTILIYFSCDSNVVSHRNLQIFDFESDMDDDVIYGHNLEGFFNRTENVKKRDVKISDSLMIEFKNIMKKIQKKPRLKDYSLGAGIYKYAMILDEDTLYLSPGLKSWRYKNRVIVYESKLIKSILTDNIE